MKFIKKLIKFIPITLLFLVVFALLLSATKGYPGNPDISELNTKKWKENGPFELSPERGRYALLYSYVEEGRFQFSLPVARFATPDLGIKNGNYVSLFAPGVSFALIPGYLLGRLFSASQFGAFATVSVFAVLNMILIVKIAQMLNVPKITGFLGSLIFLFATPAFAYTTTIYQHHFSVFLILLSIYLLFSGKINFLKLFTVWFLVFCSIPIDYPNIVLMIPIALVATFNFFKLQISERQIKFLLRPLYLFSVLGALVPLVLVMNFNYHSYGKLFQFASTVGGVQAIDEFGKPMVPETANLEDVDKFLNPEERERSAVNFFKTRHQVNGLYILLLSPDRGVLVYTPIILLGLLAFVYLKKEKNQTLIQLLFSILILNIVIYSMRSDAWGGWAFGSRYLIPAYAVMSIFLAVVIYKLRRKVLFIIPFYVLLLYSVFINTLGALTSSANPPKVEAVLLSNLSGQIEKYSFDRNWQFLTSGKSKSFVFQTWGNRYMDSVQYYILISTVIIFLLTTNLAVLVFQKDCIFKNGTSRSEDFLRMFKKKG